MDKTSVWRALLRTKHTNKYSVLRAKKPVVQRHPLGTLSLRPQRLLVFVVLVQILQRRSRSLMHIF